MARETYHGDKPEGSRTLNRCLPCWNRKNQFERHLHFLRDFSSESSLALHLRDQLGEQAEIDGTIGAITRWVDTITQQYRGSVDETGSFLHPWQAWKEAQEFILFSIPTQEAL